MSPLSPSQVSKDFVIVFEHTPFEEVEDIPLYTDVDTVAAISEEDFLKYGPPRLNDDVATKRTRNNLQLTSTPKHLSRKLHLASRSVTFSPHIQIEAISPNKKSSRSQDDSDLYPGTSRISSQDQQIKILKPQDAFKLAKGQAKTQRKQPTNLLPVRKTNKRYEITADVDIKTLNPDFIDLLPPDFDIMDSNIDKLFVSSAGGDDHSDSVSYVSTDTEDELLNDLNEDKTKNSPKSSPGPSMPVADNSIEL